MQCQKGGLITIRHNYVVDECGNICAYALTPSAVTHKPFINYGVKQTAKGEIVAEPEEEETERRKEKER